MGLPGKRQTSIPNHFSTAGECHAALRAGAVCRCGGNLTVRASNGEHWLTCADTTHWNVRVPVENPAPAPPGYNRAFARA